MRKNDEKDKKSIISVPRSSARPLPDGELKNHVPEVGQISHCKKLCHLQKRENLSWDDLLSFITKYSNNKKYLQSVSVKTA